MSAPDWTKRVRPFLNSRHLAVLLVLTAILFNGGAIFFYDDVAKHTSFFSNVWVWYGLIHTALLLLSAFAMSVRLWQWRMEQMAIFGCFFGSCVLNLLLCTYVGIATYSAASFNLKLLLWGTLLGYHGWFAWGIHRAYRRAWSEPSFRNLMLLEKEDHFIFLQLGEVEVRERIGFKAHCNPLIIVIFIVAAFATYFVRKPLIAYFDVNWVPIAYAIMAFPLATLGTSSLIVGWQYFIYPHRLSRQTGKVVYLDQISKPPGKNGNPC